METQKGEGQPSVPENGRRDFIWKAGAMAGSLAALSSAASCSKESTGPDVPGIITNKKYQWRAVTTWPPNFPVLGEAVVNMAKDIELMSGGRMTIKVYGAGELVPAMECLDAVTQGAVHMAHGASYYWTGKFPSAVFFCTIPFGMNAQQMNAWLLQGGGLQLWEKLYGEYNLVPFPCGNTGVQMGGWFNKEVNSTADLQGLKMRIPGLGGNVIAKAGASAVTVAGGEIYTSLERGILDAAEWIGPYHDYVMGFHKVAKYYYYPGWHEPGSNLELFINKKAFEELPSDLQAIIRAVAYKYNLLVLSEFEAKNNLYLQKILAESKVQLKMFPKEVLSTLKVYAREVIEDITASDPFGKEVYEQMSAFKKEITSWNEVSELAGVPYL
jgi:TRAP-type mannitol/chloroaromatic compound transport system substrate-binding protein